RYTQFARNDGSVTRTAPTIGNDGGSALHDRLPVRIGHVGDEHIARLDLVHFGNIAYPPHGTGTDFLPNGASGNQDVARGFQAVALLHVAVALRLNGLGAGLQNVDASV